MYLVIDGLRKLTDFSDVEMYPNCARWIGIHRFDEKTGDRQLLEGIKEDRKRINSWERGKFQYIDGLKKWELVEGVKCIKGKKLRGKWSFNEKKNKMKGEKIVKKCGYEKCVRNSESSTRKFKLCGKCEKVLYCSRKHQKSDWKNHKYECSYY